MPLIQRLVARISRMFGCTKCVRKACGRNAHHEAVVQAHGDWMALLATVLEREGVVSRSELAHLLADFAAVTTIDKPAEGRILAAWALSLGDIAEEPGDQPSFH